MAKRYTKKVEYICLPEKRIAQVQSLVDSWSYDTKEFMRARLNQYNPPSGLLYRLFNLFKKAFNLNKERSFEILRDPAILTDWQRRFELSGETVPRKAWNNILEGEVSNKDRALLLAMLDRDLVDVHIPEELRDLLEKVYKAHIRKEYSADPDVPKAPLILLTGTSGSGKTATAIEAIEKVIFSAEVKPEVDLAQKKAKTMAALPFWQSLEDVDPELASEILRRKKLRRYNTLSRIPIIRYIFKKHISQNLSQLDEQHLLVDYTRITPNDYQTALSGEPGNYLKKAFGAPQQTSIRHLEEAHSAFARTESSTGSGGVERQQRTLVDTSNILIDEITSGSRDCLLIATSDKPEVFDSAIYRRFVEKGIIIDISEYWMKKNNLREIIRIELRRNNVRIHSGPTRKEGKLTLLSESDLQIAVGKFYAIFAERALKVTPAYIRKLVSFLISIKEDFRAEYLDDALLVRHAFELVARNTFGDLFSKVVNHIDRTATWSGYIGDIKDTFSEMANNCLHYSVSEEKGVVLNGPPGSGKTFLVRSWLSENTKIHDISTSPSALHVPSDPIDGTVANLVKVYDIAKMIAPSMVFFDEGDSLAPRRSAGGGSPSDRLTNKFLSIIDGEKPLSKVFTVLTTNRLDLLDPALIRSKRLKVLEISGQLGQKDIGAIIRAALEGTPRTHNLTAEAIIESAKGVCNTPADYAAFVEKALSLRTTELTVLRKFKEISTISKDKQKKFLTFNLKTISGILEALEGSHELQKALRESPESFLDHYEEAMQLFSDVTDEESYPLCHSHLRNVRKETSQNPVRKGKVELDTFLEAELSQEPQKGFIVGVGANDVEGVLLPIATSLTYGLTSEKVLVTGAVSATGAGDGQLEMAVKMTEQSAQEALTLVKNYFQALEPEISMAKLLGEFLSKLTIHHQLLSASYNVGGPSAGYALALNTLSAILHIPIYNDFGITGAPWTKGVTKDEVGGSVIIGGHKKKTEKVLRYLRRMYMPKQNYNSLETDFLINYWSQGKDILGVSHFGDLVPETIWLGEDYEKLVQELTEQRIEFKLNKYQNNISDDIAKENIIRLKSLLRLKAEKEIVRKIQAIRTHLKNPNHDPLTSLEAIFEGKYQTAKKVIGVLDPIKDFFRQKRFGVKNNKN